MGRVRSGAPFRVPGDKTGVIPRECRTEREAWRMARRSRRIYYGASETLDRSPIDDDETRWSS